MTDDVAARQRQAAEITRAATGSRAIDPEFFGGSIYAYPKSRAIEWPCQACWQEQRRPWEAARTCPERVDPVSTYCDKHRVAIDRDDETQEAS